MAAKKNAKMRIPINEAEKTITSIRTNKFSTHDFIIKLSTLFPSTWNNAIKTYGIGGKGSGRSYSANSCAADALIEATKQGLISQETKRHRAPAGWGNTWITLWSKNGNQMLSDFDNDFIEQVEKSRKLDHAERRKLIEDSQPPEKKTVSTEVFSRNPHVVAEILYLANGHCECCGKIGFKKPNGDKYLEVHHLKPLSQGGSDTIQNTVAVCPDCHRELHFGANAETLAGKIYGKNIGRLKNELNIFYVEDELTNYP